MTIVEASLQIQLRVAQHMRTVDARLTRALFSYGYSLPDAQRELADVHDDFATWRRGFEPELEQLLREVMAPKNEDGTDAE